MLLKVVFLAEKQKIVCFLVPSPFLNVWDETWKTFHLVWRRSFNRVMKYPHISKSLKFEETQKLKVKVGSYSKTIATIKISFAWRTECTAAHAAIWGSDTEAVPVYPSPPNGRVVFRCPGRVLATLQRQQPALQRRKHQYFKLTWSPWGALTVTKDAGGGTGLGWSRGLWGLGVGRWQWVSAASLAEKQKQEVQGWLIDFSLLFIFLESLLSDVFPFSFCP